jgi:hypothetical protein
MDQDLHGVVRELYERYPLLKIFALGSNGAQDGADAESPPFLGVLLSTLEEHEAGAACVILPSRDRVGFTVAILAALTNLKETFAELELDRLTTPLHPGTLVRVAPEDRVYEVMEDGKEFQGQRWILLRNPVDDQTSYMPEEQAFRLTPTESVSPKPRKGMRPGRWGLAPVDRLLDIRTGGNLAIVPNRIILVAPRADTRELASVTVGCDQADRKTLISELLTWGRITKDGGILSEDGPHEPMIAVTHSVDYMATACRPAGMRRKLIIVDGARGLADNPQAFDDVVPRHRLLIISDHSELDQVGVLADRSCEVWAPEPETLLMTGGENSMDRGWFAGMKIAARNCRDFRISPIDAAEPAIELLFSAIQDLDPDAASDDEAQRLLGQAWSILVTVSGWLEAPGPASLEYFDRRKTELASGVQRSKVWISREVTDGLERFLSAATQVRESEDIGREKRHALLEALTDPSSVAVVTRSVPGAARIRRLLDRAGCGVPVYPISAVSEDHRDRVIVTSWPGRKLMGRLTSRYHAPRVDVLTYPYERVWLSSFTQRWGREWTRYIRARDEIASITGLSAWPSAPPPAPPSAGKSRAEDGDDDPVSRILSRRRKGGNASPVPETDAREARYVGFHGSGYCFLTEGHKVPVLTDLILAGQLPGDRVPMMPVRKLIPGDFVLFRDHGDQDVISALAQHEMGVETYQELRRIANLWRPALESIGSDPHTVWKRLRSAGLERSAITVRVWLTDGDLIGPRSEKDLRIISEASGDEELANRFSEVSAAIRAVWSAHISAGFKLSELLLRELPKKLPDVDEGGRYVDFIFGGGWVVCIDEVAEVPEARPYWDVNRLLFDEDG